MIRLTERPTMFVDDDGDFVTLVRDSNPGPAHNVFVCFELDTLRIKWMQRAPGDASDPHGHRDYVASDGPNRGSTWRAMLTRKALLDLVDRAATSCTYAQWEECSR